MDMTMKGIKSASSKTILVVIVVAVAVVVIVLAEKGEGLALKPPRYSRDDFPPQFVFGSGTSAYQAEGAAAEDGRTASIWDTFAHTYGKQNGDITCDQYHKYKEDVQLMGDTGLDAYRFSISWSRLIPNGRGIINPKGLQYYNNLINELISHGIQPHVTLYHFDLPQVLYDEYGGWLSREIVRDFTTYADVCFQEFGDRVSHWTTVNEVIELALGGYDMVFLDPSRCSIPGCTNPRLEPYIVAHNSLLAHASAVRLYKRKYQAKQQGIIGFNAMANWFVPLTNTTEDVTATERANAYYIGWLMDPLVFGDYPDIVKKNAGSKLPSFTQRESRQVKSSYDFIGVNHYTTMYIQDDPNNFNASERDILGDIAAATILKLEPTGEFFVNNSHGMQRILEYFKNNYGNPPIYIQENGARTQWNSSLNDTSRVEYLDGYIGSMLDAVRNGSDIRGYFVWSFLDLYEIFDDFDIGFGLYFVDRDDPDLKRHPKLSAHWYSNLLKGRNTNNHDILEVEKNIYTLPRVFHNPL